MMMLRKPQSTTNKKKLRRIFQCHKRTIELTYITFIISIQSFGNIYNIESNSFLLQTSILQAITLPIITNNLS